MLVYFSETGFFHRYYLCMLAPGLAALTGIGFRILYDCYMEGGPEGWALPVSLIANAALQALFLTRYPGWAWMILFIPGLTLAAAAVLVIGKAGVIFKGSLIRLSIIIGAAALFVLPLVWSVTPIAYGDQESAPFAGPELLNRYNYPWVTGGTNNQAGPFMGAFTALNNRGNMKLSSFLVLNRKNEKFLAGVPNAMIASPIILGTGQPVMAMGGFMGRDNILTTESLEKMVGGGEVRFFLVTIPGTNQNRAGFMTNQGNLQELFKWIIANGRRVPKDFWSVKESGMISNDFQFRPGRMAGLLNMQLYDCGGSNENSILPAISP
jgi:4-amino-4-deoxy-L-arabinose transferase-like glycosyltransferase